MALWRSGVRLPYSPPSSLLRPLPEWWTTYLGTTYLGATLEHQRLAARTTRPDDVPRRRAARRIVMAAAAQPMPRSSRPVGHTRRAGQPTTARSWSAAVPIRTPRSRQLRRVAVAPSARTPPGHRGAPMRNTRVRPQTTTATEPGDPRERPTRRHNVRHRSNGDARKPRGYLPTCCATNHS